jgi:tryptophan synthase
VTYITAGFPKAESTVDIMLGMEAGGAGMLFSRFAVRVELIIPADVIELGLPFTDPIADGPTIQKSNTVRISPVELLNHSL